MTDSVPVITQGDDEIETHIVSAVDSETIKQEEALGKQIITRRKSRRSGVSKAAELGLTEEKASVIKKPTRQRKQQQQQQDDEAEHRALLRSNSNDAMEQPRRKRAVEADEVAVDKENAGRSIFGFKQQRGKSMQSMMKKAIQEDDEPRKRSKQDHAKRLRIQRQIDMLKDDRQSDDEDEEHHSEDEDEAEDDAPAPEGYFQALQGKSQTSNNTLSKLPVLEPQEFNDILESCPKKHADDIATLMSMHKLHFNEWFFKLHAGFNLLFYGYGSKRRLLNDFVKTSLTDGAVLMINGFFPSITIKASLTKLAVDALDVPAPPAQIQDLVTLISNYFASEERAYDRLYLIVHNIDGNTLRNERAQMALSILADSPNIHLIATVDHINAGLLWDNVKTSRFNWLWHDATTFDDYLVETSFENSLLMRSGELGGARGIQYVLRSLTSNGRGVFRVLAEHQLMEMEIEGNETGKGNESVGLPYHRYYDACRESFLVSSDTTLRSLLTEFIDHKIIHSRRSSDGTEIFFIPLDKSSLCNILEEVSEQ
ncbi:origin recognition complex subunit 2-domain-containing protein [Fennellomyces sp. T-0311]|nr:origin recognition complex subunit 2-domain-containing protein [Fennellomyces sp. T-0311]